MVLDRRQDKTKDNGVFEEKVKLLAASDPCDDATHWIGHMNKN